MRDAYKINLRDYKKYIETEEFPKGIREGINLRVTTFWFKKYVRSV